MILPLQPYTRNRTNHHPLRPRPVLCSSYRDFEWSARHENDQEDVREPHSAKDSRGVYYCPVVNLFVV